MAPLYICALRNARLDNIKGYIDAWYEHSYANRVHIMPCLAMYWQFGVDSCVKLTSACFVEQTTQFVNMSSVSCSNDVCHGQWNVAYSQETMLV